MYIRRADKNDAEEAARLIRLAIQDIAEALTGEEKEERILEVLAHFFKQEKNRLSYENCMICEVDGAIAGLIISYFGGIAAELDAPLAERLRRVKNDSSLTIDKEAEVEDLYIDTLCVNQTFRRQGIGTALIQFVEQYAKEKGHERMSLVVELNNAEAQKLYTRLGYIEIKEVMIHHHPYEYRVKILQ